MPTKKCILLLSMAITLSMSIYVPAEWGEHKTIWISWSPTVNLKSHPIWDGQQNVIEALVKYIPVSLLVLPEQVKQVQTRLGHLDNLIIYTIEHSDVWIRDWGPIFVNDGAQQKVVQLDWTAWGYKGHSSDPLLLFDALTATHIATNISLPTVTGQFASEGGDREFNGLGTLMVSEVVEMQRNPHMTLEQIEHLYKSFFNVTNVVWLGAGLADDNQTFRGPIEGTDIFSCIGTGGHIDEFARFVGPNTILLAEVIEEDRNSPLGRISHKNMEENFERLSKARDQDGNPFKIVRMPLPVAEMTTIDPSTGDLYDVIKDLKFLDGTKITGQKLQVVAASSYCNFLITNGVIIAPKYNQSTDTLAKKVFQQLFPHRDVVLVDKVVNINYGGGGIHCTTQQQPFV